MYVTSKSTSLGLKRETKTYDTIGVTPGFSRMPKPYKTT